MADLFTFQESLDKKDATKAIYDVELKNWNKRKAEAAKANPDQEFKEKPPTQENIAATFGKTADGKELSAGETLINYATGGERTSLALDGLPLTGDQAKKFGAAFIHLEKNNEAPGHLHPEVFTLGSDGKPYQVEPKELSAWLQANAKAGKNVRVDQWASDAKVGLTGHGDTVQNGNEELYIETRDGQRRTFGNGNVSEPLQGYYGAIKDEKLRVGDGDYLDVYIQKDIFEQVKSGKAYDGKVFVMQEMEDGKPGELKLGYAKDVDEFRTMMTSTFSDKALFKNFEGKYLELSQEQYGRLKEEVAKEPTLTVDQFVERTGYKEAVRTPKIGAVETGKESPKTAALDIPSEVLQLVTAAINESGQRYAVAGADGSSKVPVIASQSEGRPR